MSVRYLILASASLACLALLAWLAGSGSGADVGKPLEDSRGAQPIAEGGPGTRTSGPELPHFVATTPAEVRRVVKFCRSAGTESLASLRDAALRSPDPLVAGNALRALGRLDAVAGDPGLVALVEDPRLRVRQETVLALGKSRSGEAVEVLAGLVGSAEAELRPLVLQALGELGGERSRAILRAALIDEGSTETERTIARRALERG